MKKDLWGGGGVENDFQGLPKAINKKITNFLLLSSRVGKGFKKGACLNKFA